MRKYYYITTIATIAIICLQTVYTLRLHDNYVMEKISEIEAHTKKAIIEELNLRTRDKIKRERHIHYKRISDMTPEERDSILKPPSEDDALINLTATKDSLLGKTLDDILKQLEQDQAMQNGLNLDIAVVDSLFMVYTNNEYSHLFIAYDGGKLSLNTVGNAEKEKFNYISPLYPIGTKHQLFIQLSVLIPMAEFVKFQFQILAMSAALILIIITCLLYQLIGIRRKDLLLQKREASVNGTIHDLKTPLNSIITMLSWLRMADKNPKTNDAIEICQTGVKHMAYNIESLLLTARKDRRKIVLNKNEIDVLDLVQAVKKELSFLYQGKMHTIEITDELPDDKKVYADSMYLENVIRNLIENSLKYADDGVFIRITLSVSNNMFHFTICDNGWGIAPKYRKKLFTPFYQVPRSIDKAQKGHGIGLAHAKHVIEAHGGEITVKSTENQGSIFSFTISLSKS